MNGLMRRSRRWTVGAGTVLAGMALSVVALAAPRDPNAAAPGMAYTPGAGFEAGSVLLTAPRTGSPVLIWSQDDGFSRKLVWSLFRENRWSNPKALTFGTGDDLAPVAGISSTGSVLYWIDDRGRVFFAPFDPEAGHLHAVPRPLSLGASAGWRPRPEGGSDAPIIYKACDATTGPPCIPTGPTGGGSGTGIPPRIGLDGASDAPITLSTGGTGTNSLAVASAPVCGSQVLAAGAGDSITVLSFDGAGRSTPLGQFRIDPATDRNAAVSALSAFFLKGVCR
ncbi:MAG TPA: hypothetical protein VJV75_09955 [Candidatus Polarisedimenticolia bacterium]|nr:hypothetical protein [Candidatus Polarisedimenticolia bacterium]